MIRRRLHSENGIATLIALIMVGMLTLIGLAAMSTSEDEVTIAGNELREMEAFYAAEAGLEMAAAEIQTQYETTGLPPNVMPTGELDINRCGVTYTTSDVGPAVQRTLITGTLAGLHALVKSFSITSTGASNIDPGSVLMSQSFETALVPIFQFAVFYENDLYTTPANYMLISGRVHVNGNMYLQGSSGLDFDGRVTASGGIYHGFPSWLGIGVAGGDVRLADQSGNLQSMNQGGTWLDASSSDWFDKASTLWGGNVADAAFGEEDLNLPLTNTSLDPHKMIERSTGNPDSYQTKADLQIIDGIPLAKIGGVFQDISAWLPAGTITSTTFYDDRENKWIDCTEIDMSLLSSSSYFPDNGVIYQSDQTASTGMNGTRLTNGTDIGYPMSLFSENPVYVKGDFNTVDKQPAAVVADAVSFLSNDWSDANSDKALRTYRTVSSTTTVNLSFITGDQEPESASYGGGLANLPRFLEHWSGTKFTIRGSMVALWRSQQSTGLWTYGGTDEYYTAPTRDYGFDAMLDDPSSLPPETPVVRIFQRVGWQQQYVAIN